MTIVGASHLCDDSYIHSFTNHFWKTESESKVDKNIKVHNFVVHNFVNLSHI